MAKFWDCDIKDNNHKGENGLCPICGEMVYIMGETTDDRIIGSCFDAFPLKLWLD